MTLYNSFLSIAIFNGLLFTSTIYIHIKIFVYHCFSLGYNIYCFLIVHIPIHESRNIFYPWLFVMTFQLLYYCISTENWPHFTVNIPGKYFCTKKKKRQIFLLFFGAMWLLILKLMLFQKQGGCKLIFAPVWLCLSWLPNEEFKKVEIKFLEPKTVPKTWKYKASSSQHRIIKNIILSLSFSSHSFWIYVFFLNSILPFLWKEGLLFWGIVVGYLLGQKELQCNKGSWRKTSFTYGWKEAKNARFKLAVSLTLSRI